MVKRDSFTSATVRVLVPALGGFGSGVRIDRVNNPPIRNATASTTIAIGAVSHCTRTPANPGPAVWATEPLSEILALPTMSWLELRIVGRYARSATCEKTEKVPVPNETT